jgi:peroxidase
VYNLIFVGDLRTNEQPSLISQHTLWLRQHNRIARKLEVLFGSTWDDERIYQEARKIVGAVYQHITYNEFLPVVLGRKIMRLFDLNPKRKGKYFKKYNPDVHPNHRQGFMTAAYRFGHSLINSRLRFTSASGTFRRTRFRELFNKPDPLYQPEGVEEVIRGLYTERCQAVDRYITIDCFIRLIDFQC